ncbi:hypothetical protein PIB30_090535, partial [Stylosanthes scabra]|nr:hypothetical protein [Stylosanthes scabra]
KPYPPSLLSTSSCVTTVESGPAPSPRPLLQCPRRSSLPSRRLCFASVVLCGRKRLKLSSIIVASTLVPQCQRSGCCLIHT